MQHQSIDDEDLFWVREKRADSGPDEGLCFLHCEKTVSVVEEAGNCLRSREPAQGLKLWTEAMPTFDNGKAVEGR